MGTLLHMRGAIIMRGRVWLIGLLLLAACSPQATPPTATEPAAIATNTPIPPATFAATTSSQEVTIIATATDFARFTGCPDAPTSRLIVQERGQVTPSDETLNLREGPSTDFEIRTRIEPEEFFFVIDGPECSGGYTWFQIRYGRFEGWIAEGDSDGYYVQPYLPG